MNGTGLAVSASLGISWAIVAERGGVLLFLLLCGAAFFYLRNRRPRG
jgi:hypothetical protein